MISTISFGFYEVRNNGVLIYISDSTPTLQEQYVIDQWKKVHFIELHYEGPEKYRKNVENLLKACGIFEGGNDPFFIKLYEGFGYVVIWMWKGGKSWDNFSSPVKSSELDLAVKDGITHFFLCSSVPDKSFVVYVSEDSIVTKIIDFNGRPVTFKRIEKEFYNVFIDGEATSMEAGFHRINSSLVFVGKEGQKISSIRFFKGVKMVYPIGDDFAILEGNSIRFPDGKKVMVYEEPLYVGKNFIVYRDSIQFNGKLRMVESTILDSNGRVVLEADGSVEDIEGRWRMKVSGIPIEWYFKSNILYILDIGGFIREFDTIKKKILFEKRYPGSYGFDFINGKLVVGVPDGVLFNGKKLDVDNFCVAKNRIWDYKNCVRLHNGLSYVRENGKVKILGKNMETFANKVRQVNGWLILAGNNGVWVVKVGN